MVFDKERASLTCGKCSIAIHPDDGITLRVSNTTITMTDTNIELEAETIRAHAKKNIVLAAQGDVKVSQQAKSQSRS